MGRPCVKLLTTQEISMPNEFRPFEPFPEEIGYQAKTQEERQFETNIRACTDIDQVRDLVLKRGNIPSASSREGFHSSEVVIRRIDQVRNGHREIWQGRLTRTFGIRETIERLLPTDKTYMKRMAQLKKKREK